VECYCVVVGDLCSCVVFGYREWSVNVYILVYYVEVWYWVTESLVLL
jgi:hypothetical protein